MTEVKGDKIILAIPPYHLTKILQGTDVKDAFGDINQLKDWEKKTRYISYIPIVFHWNKEIKLEKIWGFPRSEWGIAFVVLTDYMSLVEADSKTVISVVITINEISSVIGKTPNQCNKKELINETLRQLKETFPNLPIPSHSLLEQTLIIIKSGYQMIMDL